MMKSPQIVTPNLTSGNIRSTILRIQVWLLLHWWRMEYRILRRALVAERARIAREADARLRFLLSRNREFLG